MGRLLLEIGEKTSKLLDFPPESQGERLRTTESRV
jgi:hypothetical protein